MIADYHAKKINLAQGWHGAQVCVEYPDTKVSCYDTVAESDRATGAYTAVRDPGESFSHMGRRLRPKSIDDCPSPWVCLWQNANYTGRKLEWSASGTKTLGS